MYKTAKFFKSIRLFAYIIVLSYIVQTSVNIGIDLVNGKVNETLFYKGFSLVWAIVSFISLKSIYEMWNAIDSAVEDIKELKEKGHDVAIVNPLINDNINKLLRQKDKKDLPN